MADEKKNEMKVLGKVWTGMENTILLLLLLFLQLFFFSGIYLTTGPRANCIPTSGNLEQRRTIECKTRYDYSFL